MPQVLGYPVPYRTSASSSRLPTCVADREGDTFDSPARWQALSNPLRIFFTHFPSHPLRSQRAPGLCLLSSVRAKSAIGTMARPSNRLQQGLAGSSTRRSMDPRSKSIRSQVVLGLRQSAAVVIAKITNSLTLGSTQASMSFETSASVRTLDLAGGFCGVQT